MLLIMLMDNQGGWTNHVSHHVNGQSRWMDKPCQSSCLWTIKVDGQTMLVIMLMDNQGGWTNHVSHHVHGQSRWMDKPCGR